MKGGGGERGNGEGEKGKGKGKGANYPKPSLTIFHFDLLLVADPIAVPSPQRSRVMHPNRIHPFHLEPRPLQLIDKPPQRRARVRAGEDILVHEEPPDQVLVLPALAQPRDLQEEDAVVVEHVVDLPQERREVPHAHVLGHFQAGDLAVAARGYGDVAVVHAQNPALAFFDPRFAHRVVAEGGLVPTQRHARGVGAVLRAGVFGKGAPAAANVEEGFAGLERDLFADDGELVVLELFEGFFGVDVGDYAAGVDHTGAEEPAVEVVAAVVVVADLFFVCDCCQYTIS